MKKFGKSLLMLICVIGLIAIFTGGCLQDLITPLHVESEVIEYSNTEPTSYLPWPTLWDGHRLKRHIDYQHQLTQLVYKRLQQDDKLKYSFVVDTLDTSVIEAERFQSTFFDPKGSIGMALAALFAGVPCALFIKRPGDKSKKELDILKA